MDHVTIIHQHGLARLAHPPLHGQQRVGSVLHPLGKRFEFYLPVEEAVSLDPVPPGLPECYDHAPNRFVANDVVGKLDAMSRELIYYILSSCRLRRHRPSRRFHSESPSVSGHRRLAREHYDRARTMRVAHVPPGRQQRPRWGALQGARDATFRVRLSESRARLRAETHLYDGHHGGTGGAVMVRNEFLEGAARRCPERPESSGFPGKACGDRFEDRHPATAMLTYGPVLQTRRGSRHRSAG